MNTWKKLVFSDDVLLSYVGVPTVVTKRGGDFRNQMGFADREYSSRYRSAAKEKNYPANCSPVCTPQENSSCTKIALRQKSAD